MGYVVKNTLMLVTMPFSMAINEVISWFQVGMATKTFLHDVSTMDFEKVYNNEHDPTYTLVEEIDRYYITNFNDEVKMIGAEIDIVSKIVTQSLTPLIHLIITQLKESPQNPNLTKFIKIMEDTKETKIRMVSNNASNEFNSVLFGSTNNAEAKGAAKGAAKGDNKKHNKPDIAIPPINVTEASPAAGGRKSRSRTAFRRRYKRTRRRSVSRRSRRRRSHRRSHRSRRFYP
jgi:hypothetical protein